MKKNIILIIDTSSSEEISVGLRDGATGYKKTAPATTQKSQAVLPMIAEILKERELSWSDIGAIEVTEGPGSFTGLRVGFAVANALGFLFDVPVNGKTSGLAMPQYTKA